MESATIKTPEPKPPTFIDGKGEAVELRKLILKLRWIGHEGEAERLCAVLGRRAPGQICVEQPLVTD